MSLTKISAVVVILAIILLGVGAYLLGRRTSQNTSASPDKIHASYNPGTTRPGAGYGDVIPGLKTHRPKSNGSKMVPDDAQRQKGYSYLVIQGGVRTPKEALDIKKFLYEMGINATVHRSSHTGMYMVKDMHGFTNIRSEQTRAAIREHVAQIERLGKEYQSRGGRHGFKQDSITPWMITEK